MNARSYESACKLVPSSYLSQAMDAAKNRESKISHLIEQRKIPLEGWTEEEVRHLLHELAQMDSNNFPSHCGTGEREARIFSGLVYRRNFGMGHGIGRSGDLTEVQPKASGSSLLNKLTNALVLDVIRQSGVRSCSNCFVVPVATGMAMTLCLLSTRKVRSAKYVLWSRIDQKSCFKSITTAGFQPVVIELAKRGDELVTNLAGLEAAIHELGPDNVAAVMSTTSCFAPRVPDDVPEIAKLCRRFSIPHFINNAYGVQSSKCMHEIEEAFKTGGRIDAFVQSTDKNFMVPVGGAVIAGFNSDYVDSISKTYPGRASSSPTIDLFITLMMMGINGYKKLIKERKEIFNLLRTNLEKVAEKYGERVMVTKANPISMAMTLSTVECSDDGKSVSDLGSKLFTRGISGTRVITGIDSKTIDGHHFKAWGSHHDDINIPYLTAAAAIGMTKDEVFHFIKKLDKVLESKIKKS